MRPNTAQLRLGQTASTFGAAVRVEPVVAWSPMPMPAQPVAKAGGSTAQLTAAVPALTLTGGPTNLAVTKGRQSACSESTKSRWGKCETHVCGKRYLPPLCHSSHSTGTTCCIVVAPCMLLSLEARASQTPC